ncbi:MAG TPA: TetR/AcrR family transcriptional regulator, partial [Terrimesophilobacter sp.]|nr:TetR/AcrR family transcriptional regulator [Terrimesophilobacter sp.]
SRAKANRREALLTAAARLFAERGYNGVSLEELGAAAGVSGPAVYRHFDGKQALLGALLVGVSENLSSGGQAVVTAASDDAAALRALVQFHVDFALSNPDVIRVQGQDLGNLAEDDRHAVRALQRTYVELWVEVLGRLHPGVDTASLRIRAHAAFGLINSTPHSARTTDTRAILEQMALAGLVSVSA